MQNDLLTYYEKMFSEYPDVVNVKTMCKMLGGISTKTGYRLLKDNKIKSFKIGRAFYITKFHILSYLQINVVLVKLMLTSGTQEQGGCRK